MSNTSGFSQNRKQSIGNRKKHNFCYNKLRLNRKQIPDSATKLSFANLDKDVFMTLTRLIIACVLMLAITGCGAPADENQNSGTTYPSASQPSQTSNAKINDKPDNLVFVTHGTNLSKQQIENSDFSILFIGNSHTYHVPNLLGDLFGNLKPKSKVLIVRAPGVGFLNQHAKNPSTLKLLNAGIWRFVVLQAQKYSTTGRYRYPYDGAYTLSDLATQNGSKDLMFPEWSRKQVPDEYKRITKRKRKKGAGFLYVINDFHVPVTTWQFLSKRMYLSEG